MGEMISEKTGEAAKRELTALLEMTKGEGWRTYFQPLLAAKVQERLNGLSARGLTPEKRAEHLEGYYDAEELTAWVGKRMEHLMLLVTAYNQQ